ncbi:MAG: hypothetical protein KGJ86_12525 [Chloroflexota bacterium]|nr:hypothetical protein [Chloroflexota bacterium]
MPRRAAKAAKILFGVGSWGLGHATRDLPLIRGLVAAGHAVTVLGSGGSLAVLRRELGDGCDFIDFPGMRVPLGQTPFRFYLKYTLMLPLIWWETLRQRQLLVPLLAAGRFDLIISDNRYAIWSETIPSLLIAHGLRFIAPGRQYALELGLELFNARSFRPFKLILIPDFERMDLSGDLSHRLRYYDRARLRYLGLLSSVARQDTATDLDVFISVSGPEPQRTILERRILEQLPRVRRHGLVALGRPDLPQRYRIGDWEVAGYLNRQEQAAAMNRCRLAVVRGGYTTLMELAELSRPAVLIPTPGQTEQEYLVAYHSRLGHHLAARQATLDLEQAIAAPPPAHPFIPPHLTDVSVQRFLEIVGGC